MKITLLMNFILFQAAWFITVFSASLGQPWFGPVFSLCWLYSHLGLHQGTRKSDLQIVIIAALLGFTLDSIMVVTGVFSFPDTATLGYPSTLWMVALWINLALTLDHSLGWLKEKLLLSAVFAGIGGPLAYYAGSKFGVIQFNDLHIAMTFLSLMWALVMPLLLYILRLLTMRTREVVMTI